MLFRSYAFQDAYIVSATAVAAAGAVVAQVPRHTVSLWNDYQWHPRLNTGVGVQYRTAMFAAVDNAVVLPGYVRADASVQVGIRPRARVQLNVENLFNASYYLNADSNTNISPGGPRAAKVSLVVRF